MENVVGNVSGAALGSQCDDKDRFDAWNLADVRDHRANIRLMIRRRFDRDPPLFHLKAPVSGLRVLFQQTADLLLKIGFTVAENSDACAAQAFNALERRV